MIKQHKKGSYLIKIVKSTDYTTISVSYKNKLISSFTHVTKRNNFAIKYYEDMDKLHGFLLTKQWKDILKELAR